LGRLPAKRFVLFYRMIKKIFLVIALLTAFLAESQAQLFEFSSRDAAKLTGRKLIVVLHEEDPEVLRRIKKDDQKTARYKAMIAYSNEILQKAVPMFWNTGRPYEFRTFSECLALADSSEAYFTLEFSSLRQNENLQLYLLKPDTASSIYTVRRELMRRKEYGSFELKLIEKFRATPFYSFTTPASIPNEYDFITAIQFISSLVREKLESPKLNTRNYELKIQQNNPYLFLRTLLVDSTVVNKQGRSYDYIRREYDSTSAYQLSDPAGIAALAYTQDTALAYLAIVPYVDPIARGQSFGGTAGGSINDYEKRIFFMQLIFDVRTGELLYYDKTEEAVVVPRDWKRFLRHSSEQKFFLLPKNTNTNHPQNQE
jgi:hypothetical protein